MQFSRILLAGSLGLAVGAARASEGVLEINQTCATTTGCFPGDDAGFPVTITSVAGARSFRLTSDLDLQTANTTGIQITSSSAQIDLGGFTIDGLTQCSGIPVTSCIPVGSGVGVNGGALVTVKNGTIMGMGSDGVRLGFSGRVEGVSVLHCGDDGFDLGSQNVVRGNIATSNGGAGVRCNSQCVVSENTATGNGSDGIVVPSGAVTGNTATQNGGRGGLFGSNTAFANNLFSQNLPPDQSGGHASGGNLCGDGSCSRRGARRFYLTRSRFTGSSATGACGLGYHFASMWELVDSSGLEYDTARGFQQEDSGQGPPADCGSCEPEAKGWVRTGYYNTTFASSFPGHINCGGWISAAPDRYGTAIFLGTTASAGNSGTWNKPPEAITSPWYPVGYSCDTPLRVWCIED